MKGLMELSKYLDSLEEKEVNEKKEVDLKVVYDKVNEVFEVLANLLNTLNGGDTGETEEEEKEIVEEKEDNEGEGEV